MEHNKEKKSLQSPDTDSKETESEGKVEPNGKEPKDEFKVYLA